MKMSLQTRANEISNHSTLCCEMHNLLCNDSHGDLFACEDNMLLNSCEDMFSLNAHKVFHLCQYNEMVSLNGVKKS